MEEIIRQFPSLTDWSAREVAINAVDILLVAYVIYRLLVLVRGTRAWRIAWGIIIFLAILWLSDKVHLYTLHWLLERASLLGPVALVILFLPELRTTVEQFGSLPQRLVPISGVEERAEARTIEELVAACSELAAESVGALVVIELGTHLEDIVSNGVLLNARVSAPLLGSIFYEGNPLHDGAVILRGDMIVAAACRLPLSESVRLDQTVHMRHRAAVGISESSDCIAIVVSEERGTISVAVDGRLRRLNAPLELRELLNKHLRHISGESGRENRRRLRISKLTEARQNQVEAEQ